MSFDVHCRSAAQGAFTMLLVVAVSPRMLPRQDLIGSRRRNGWKVCCLTGRLDYLHVRRCSSDCLCAVFRTFSALVLCFKATCTDFKLCTVGHKSHDLSPWISYGNRGHDFCDPLYNVRTNTVEIKKIGGVDIKETVPKSSNILFAFCT